MSKTPNCAPWTFLCTDEDATSLYRWYKIFLPPFLFVFFFFLLFLCCRCPFQMSRIIQVYDEEKQSNVQVRCFVHHTDGFSSAGTRKHPKQEFLTLSVILSSSSSSSSSVLHPFWACISPPGISTLFTLSSLFQADSEVAEAGKAVSLYFEERLLEIFPEQTFPVMMEKETQIEAEKEDSEDSDDDIVQPKRKRLKVDTEKLLHIK